MIVEKVFALQEEHEERYFFIKEESDYNRLALMILRERFANGVYPSHKNLGVELQEKFKGYQTTYRNDPRNLEGAIANLREYYEPALEWAVKLENMLALPDEEALQQNWVFEDGEKAPLAYILFSARRELEFEGYYVLATEPF